ncbi:hypothetical protein QQS21_004127 [Conoideocrella luteorostrata]|uniref:Uncharacterized protein n=1 Tax=Conoideocrella luteorostrata TaxID=1105319 RepID=A0AAJ0FUX7_9HYPO|nr:hypothetical protein QQS21_004127 [Conoideocrella luteorostrata]
MPQSGPKITSQAQSYRAEVDRAAANCSSFFREKRANALPPNKFGALNRKSGHIRADSFNRPPPVRIPELGLLVKYGSNVTVHEAKIQMMICDTLRDHVPIPEVLGWIVDRQ